MQADKKYNYKSHLESSKVSNIPTTASGQLSNNAENDSGSNFDDGSSCASDSAIGKILHKL